MGTKEMKFTERLRQAANHAGVGPTQAAIADALGLNRQTVNRWFFGSAPTVETLMEIARKWNVSADWLATGDGEMIPPSPDGLSVEERELVRSYRSASPQVRKVLATMARAARKSVLFIVATIPPLLSPSNTEAGVLHNTFASTAAILHIGRKLLKLLHLSLCQRFAM